MRGYRASDYAEMAGWYAARGEKCPSPEGLPHIGIFAPGLACGFLYRTDSTVSLIEGMVTNPAAPLRARTQAVRAIAETLLLVANGPVVALTKAHGIATLAARLGMRPAGSYSMMVR